MKKRIFLGIPVSITYQNKLSESLEPLQKNNADWRWVQKENYHVTVCFIGEVEISAIKSLRPLIKKVISDTKQFTLKSNSFHLAPIKKPRMLWSGFEESTQFADMVIRVEEELSKLVTLPDYRKNNHPLPHITLARFPYGSVNDVALPELRLTLPVHSIDLFESIQSNKGPYYKKAEEFLLGK